MSSKRFVLPTIVMFIHDMYINKRESYYKAINNVRNIKHGI